MDNEESVYRLIPQPEPEPVKEPMYHSRHIPPPIRKRSVGVIGTSVAQTVSPSEFLKKTQRDLPQSLFGLVLLFVYYVITARPFHYHEKDPISPKPPVPKRDEEPIHGLQTGKNFVASNAIEVILSGLCVDFSTSGSYFSIASKKPAQREFLYTQRPGYGQVPEYLLKIKEEVDKERTFYDTQQQEREVCVVIQNAHTDSVCSVSGG